MKKIIERFQAAMTAVAFAEAGEFETAREIVTEAEEALSSGESQRSAGTKIIRSN